MLLNNIVGMLTGSAGEVFGNVDKEYKMGRTDVNKLEQILAALHSTSLIYDNQFCRFGFYTGGT